MNNNRSSAVWAGLVLCFLFAGVAVPLAIARSAGGGNVGVANASNNSSRSDLNGLPPEVQQAKLDAERQARQSPPTLPPPDARPQLALPAQDTGSVPAINAARREAVRLIAEDQKLLNLPDLPSKVASSPAQSIDESAKAELPSFKAGLPQRTNAVWVASKSAERAKQRDEQSTARVVAGGLPQADDARLEVTAWHPLAATDSEIVGSLDGWMNQHWMNPVTSRGSIPVDGSGWQSFNPGLVRTFQFRLVKEAGAWRLDTLYSSDNGSGPPQPTK